jgi:hypothetical protein
MALLIPKFQTSTILEKDMYGIAVRVGSDERLAMGVTIKNQKLKKQEQPYAGICGERHNRAQSIPLELVGRIPFRAYQSKIQREKTTSR